MTFQTGTDITAAAGDAAPAAHPPGVAVDRRDTDQGGEAAAVELAEFRQIGDQGM